MNTRRLKVFLFLICLAALPQLDARAALFQSQSDLNQSADDALARANREMNSMMQKIIKQNASDKVFVARLRASQRAWIAFRDAEIAARFPLAKGQDAQFEYGTVYPMCVENELLGLTQDRIQQLKQWLTPEPEGDVCEGSWPMKQDE